MLLAAPAWALLGTITANVRDAKTDRPLDDAFVFARERGDISRIHGSITVCMRAGVGPVVGGMAKLQWPLPSVNPLIGRRRLETIAYSPGHCAAEGSADGQTLRLKPVAHSPHERLMYLDEFAGALLCPNGRWGEGSDIAMARLAEAVDRELEPLERDAFGRKMARSIRERLDIARSRPSANPYLTPEAVMAMTAMAPRDFVFAPANQKPLAIHCRHGATSACDYDERSERGETPLGEMIRLLKEEEVKLLLEAGADPSVPVEPGGPKAVEALVGRMLYVTPQSRGADSVREILQLLVAHPKASLPGKLKTDLALDPKDWQEVRHLAGVSLLEQYREALSALPAHADAEFGCYRISGANSLGHWGSFSARLRIAREPPKYPPAPPIRPDLGR